MSERTLAPLRRGGFRVACVGDDPHLHNRGDGEPKSLTRFEPRRAYDLDLHLRLVPVTHPVDGFAAEVDLPPKFTDSEFAARRDGNLPRGGGQCRERRSTRPGAAPAPTNLSIRLRSGLSGGAYR